MGTRVWKKRARMDMTRSKPGPKPRGTSTGRVRLELRLTDDERARWSAAAESAGVALSEYVRRVVERAIERNDEV